MKLAVQKRQTNRRKARSKEGYKPAKGIEPGKVGHRHRVGHRQTETPTIRGREDIVH